MSQAAGFELRPVMGQRIGAQGEGKLIQIARAGDERLDAVSAAQVVHEIAERMTAS